ncbi:MAG: hypothetical protein ACYC1K_00345 [Minisyncoccota bacterium]
MDPKFQSSFIPKGPLVPSSAVFKSQPAKRGTLLGLITMWIFILSILAALVAFGYGFYLNSSIKKMGGDLEAARANLEPETIREMARLDARIVGTEKLLANHAVLSPLFDFLESNTLKTVRFTQFTFKETSDGLTVSMRGQARGYAALALQADIFNKSKDLKSTNFSNLDLDERGNVVFVVDAVVSPNLVSYKRVLESKAVVVPPLVAPVATSTSSVVATSTRATTTPPKN